MFGEVFCIAVNTIVCCESGGQLQNCKLAVAAHKQTRQKKSKIECYEIFQNFVLYTKWTRIRKNTC